jgi:hypothetical protein
MKYIHRQIAQASYVTTQDLFELAELKPYAKSKIIHAIACTGSAAAFDTGYELKDGELVMARGFNTSTSGMTDVSAERIPVGAVRMTDAKWSMFPTVNAGGDVFIGLWVD